MLTERHIIVENRVGFGTTHHYFEIQSQKCSQPDKKKIATDVNADGYS